MKDASPSRPKLSAQAKSERARDQAAAMLEYQADRLAVQAKTEKLRALRLAKEAADRDRVVPAPRAKVARRKRPSATAR